jgi:hypothetical protein
MLLTKLTDTTEMIFHTDTHFIYLYFVKYTTYAKYCFMQES